MALLESLNAAIAWLEQAKQELAQLQPQPEPPEQPQESSPTGQIAWGSRVSPSFRERIKWIADNLGCPVNSLMACMAWESGETFRSDIKNAAGSGATGLIQFMPSTAVSLGTTTAALAAMTPEDQLKYVYNYFLPYKGRLHNLGDVYAAILWPAAVEKPDHYVLFDKAKVPKTFRQNAGLDLNKDGLVTRAECLVKINEKLAKGLLPQNLG